MGDLTRALGMTRTPSSYLGKWVHYTEECEHENMVGENMLASHDHDHDHLHDHLNDKNSVFVSGKETTVIILRRVNMTGFIGRKTEWTAKVSSLLLLPGFKFSLFCFSVVLTIKALRWTMILLSPVAKTTFFVNDAQSLSDVLGVEWTFFANFAKLSLTPSSSLYLAS